jgi:hypothetical protein
MRDLAKQVKNTAPSHPFLHQSLSFTSLDGISEDAFFQILSEIRKERSGGINKKQIVDAFAALYYGTCPADDQRDGFGMYILVKDLRWALTNYGEILTDEEADELICECCGLKEEEGRGLASLSLDEKNLNDRDIIEVDEQKKVYFDQYMTMLLEIAL